MALVLAAVPAVAGTATPARAAVGDCHSVILYFSRGSGQKFDPVQQGLGRPGAEVYAALRAEYSGTTVSVGAKGNAYQAVRVTDVRTLLKDRERYRVSVATGVTTGLTDIAALIRRCPRSQLVLGGFSQGAQVTRGILAGLPNGARSRVAAVVLFGDPLFLPGEGEVEAEPSSVDRRSYNVLQSGILRQRPGKRPVEEAVPIDATYAGKVFSWCHFHDLVCQGVHFRNGLTAHFRYAGEARAAVGQIAATLTRLKLITPAAVTSAGHKAIGGPCGSSRCDMARWSGPGTSSFVRIATLAEGQRIDITCQAMGETVHGANGKTSAIWDRLPDGSFVPDYYVDTNAVGSYTDGIARCRGLSVAP